MIPSNHRPTPEAMLMHLKEEEEQIKSGKLKIFLGAAPGVGKTFTMLEEALEKKAKGVDVIIGIVETHGRKDTASLLKNLEILDLVPISYQGKQLSEFALDQAIKRHPDLILVDEMAHTNIKGTRHTKRWQDIKELLDRGIDVYTTLNVQHIESLNDIIAQITTITVHETVPDSVLELASSIEIVDLPPEDLLRRLKEGKVYYPAQAEIAAENFFQKGNLIALRELALRIIAERVDSQLVDHRHAEAIDETWPTSERLLVCVDAKEGTRKLIRAACRMATTLKAEWIAVHVETLKSTQKHPLHHTLKLAEQLGAETFILNGNDIVKEIMCFARERNVTKLILRKPFRPFWKKFLLGSLIKKFIRHSGEIDVCIIQTNDLHKPIKAKNSFFANLAFSAYVFSLLTTFFATLLNLIIFLLLGPLTVVMVYALSTALVSKKGYIGPALLASLLSTFAFDFFFIPPYYHFRLENPRYTLAFLSILLIAQLISQLMIVFQKQAQLARQRERHTSALYGLSRRLAFTRGKEKLIKIAAPYIGVIFDAQVAGFLSNQQGHLLNLKGGEKNHLNQKEQSIAQWVYEMGEVAGLGTQTLPQSKALYFPLQGSKRRLGVLRVEPKNPDFFNNPKELHLLEAFVTQLSLALEVEFLAQASQETEKEIDREHLRQSLFKSLLKQLHLQAASVFKSASTLYQNKDFLKTSLISRLSKALYNDSHRLNQLLNKIEKRTNTNTSFIHQELQALKPIFTSLVKELKKSKKPPSVHLNIPDSLPPLYLDKELIHDMLIKLIDNAIAKTSPASSLDIHVRLGEDHIRIDILNKGRPNELTKKEKDKENILDSDLLICQSIIEAHGGKLQTMLQQKGALYSLSLPLYGDEKTSISSSKI